MPDTPQAEPAAPELILIHAWKWVLDNDHQQSGPCHEIILQALDRISELEYPNARWQLFWQ